LTKSAPDKSNEKLKELLRRIEQIPIDGPPTASPPRAPPPIADRSRTAGQSSDLSALQRPMRPTSAEPPARMSLGTKLAMATAGLVACLGIAFLVLVHQWPADSVVTADQHRPGAPAPIINLPSTSQSAVQASVDPDRPIDAPAAKTVVASGRPDVAPPVKTASTGDVGSANIRVVLPPVAVEARASAHFILQTEPALDQNSPLEVTIRQVPSGITFNRGVRHDADTWVFTASSLGVLEVTAGDLVEGRWHLPVELRSADGKILSQTALDLSVAAPAPIADREPLDDSEQSKLLGQGLMMLATGNVNSARLLLQRAAESGNGHAALILGDTYDADRLARIGATSVVPERNKAAYWYGRADELGEYGAKERLSEMNAH
jgi:hypothetical protein